MQIKSSRPLYFILTSGGKDSYGGGKKTPLCSRDCHLMDPSPSTPCSHHLNTSSTSSSFFARPFFTGDPFTPSSFFVRPFVAGDPFSIFFFRAGLGVSASPSAFFIFIFLAAGFLCFFGFTSSSSDVNGDELSLASGL